MDPITNESEIIFDTENNFTRILGYQNGTVYLLDTQTGIITSNSLDGEVIDELFQLPSLDYSYDFIWQGGYLLIENTTPGEIGELFSIKVNLQ